MIQIKNLKLAFTKEYYALYNINLQVKNKEKLCLLGDSQSGKTTLLRAIAGLEQKESGQILINQRDIKDIDFSKDISLGYLAQKGVFFAGKSVYQNLLYVLKIRGVDSTLQKIKILQALREYNIEHLQHQKIKTLSDYQKMLVQFARLALRKIDIYLIDNIFDNLAKEEEDNIIRCVQNLQKEPATFIIATTKEDLATKLGDRVVRLHLGSIKK